MTLPSTQQAPLRVIPIEQGGTGASTAQGARDNLEVPGKNTPLENIDGAWTVSGAYGGWSFNTSVDFNDTVDGTYIAQPIVGPRATRVEFDFTATTAPRLVAFPDASGTLVLSPDAPSHGSILWWNGTKWASLAPGTVGQTLHIDGSGNLYWA